MARVPDPDPYNYKPGDDAYWSQRANDRKFAQYGAAMDRGDLNSAFEANRGRALSDPKWSSFFELLNAQKEQAEAEGKRYRVGFGGLNLPDAPGEAGQMPTRQRQQRRPSMAALAGDEPSYYSSEDVAPTYEQRRQAAVLAAADARAESGLDQAQRQNARDTDLFGGGAAARERAVGDIQDEATKRQARTQGEIYFDPLQQRMQRARFQEQMDMLDKRFVEGQREKLDAQEREASEKAATTREANALKASTALDVERLRGDSRNTSAGTRAQGQVDAALVKQGKPVTPAASELPEKTFTEKSLAKYAADTGQSLAEAAMELKGKGYKWVGSVPIIQAIVPR